MFFFLCEKGKALSNSRDTAGSARGDHVEHEAEAVFEVEGSDVEIAQPLFLMVVLKKKKHIAQF